MPKRVLRIGHATAQSNTFLGKEREITVDLTKKSLIAHDGLTVGGFPSAKEDLSTSPIAVAGSKDGKMSSTQATELADAVSKNTAQDGRLDGMDTLNTTQTNRLDAMDTKNTAQDTSITTNTTNVAANLAKINTNITNVATNTTNIATNTTNIATNTTILVARDKPPKTAGSATAYTGVLNITSYITDTIYELQIHASNTGNTGATLNLDGKGVLIIKKLNGSILMTLDLLIGMLGRFLYNGTDMILLNPSMASKGALVLLSASQARAPTSSLVSWGAEEYDTSNIHSTSVNPERLTVPGGVKTIKLGASCMSLSTDTAKVWVMQLFFNGSSPISAGRKSGAFYHVGAGLSTVAWSAKIDVVSGNYFELYLGHNATGNITLNLENSWFAMEIIE